jgi:hypothetical protein
LVYNQLTCANMKAKKYRIFRNRMTAKPGFGAIGAQRIGNACAAVNEMLMQSASPAPGKDPVIHLFPACPKDWTASFSLLARGAFVVNGRIEKGRVGPVSIRSTAGRICTVSNPWPGRRVRLQRVGEGVETLSGKVLSFTTVKGETVTLLPAEAVR